MMKKVLFILIIAMLTFSSLYSLDFDWGGAFQNTTDVSSVGKWSVSQTDSLNLWAELDVNPMLNFKMSAGYRFNYDSFDKSVSHIPEFGTLYAYGSNDFISYKAGRFSLSDMNHNLFSTIIDGVQFGIVNQKIKIKSGVGFTGLVFSDNSNIAMTVSDYNLKSSDSFKLASPRLAEYVEAAFYILPGDGSVTAAFLAQQDMLASSEIETNEGLLHSFYLNLGLKGRLWNFVFYNLYGTGEIGLYEMEADDRSILLAAVAGGLKVHMPLPLPLKPLVAMELYYSSGDDWSRTDHGGSAIGAGKTNLYQFTPFSLQNKGYIYSVSTGNLFYGNIGISISPVSSLSVLLESLTLFRSKNGPVSTMPVTEADSDSSLFLGEEITLAVNFRPLSDMGFQLKGGIFIPNDSVVSGGIQYKVGGFMSLSF